METAETQENKEVEEIKQNLRDFPVGAKLIVQCRKDWRAAVVSHVSEEKIILQIYSPTGRMYRKSYATETLIDLDGIFPILGNGEWRDGLAKYDLRW